MIQYHAPATAFIRAAAKVITKELLKPRGLNPPPRLPMFATNDMLEPFVDGKTMFDPETHKPVGILLRPAGHPGELAATLAHELVHAALPFDVGHEGAFAETVKAIGLDGDPRSTYAGPQFVAWAETSLLPVMVAKGLVTSAVLGE